MSRIAIVFMLLLIAVGLPGYADEGRRDESLLLGHPGAELWHEIRGGSVDGNTTSQVRGVDSNVLINAAGDRWARLRVDVIAEASPLVLVGALLVLMGFYAIRGRARVEGGCSDQMVHRFTNFQRVVHWLLAFVFLYLAVTGLILLLGREFLIPLIGKELFSVLASASKESHNLLGPIFTLSIILMLVEFGNRNRYEKGDIEWLLNGGVAGKTHVAAGFFNLGEKIWFWILIVGGMVVSISGLVLVMQNFGQGRIVMEISHIVHVVTAVLLIAVSLGHMYLGSVGMEGSLQSMKNGYVDLNWAKTHHSRWAQELEKKEQVLSAQEYRALLGEKQSAANADSTKAS